MLAPTAAAVAPANAAILDLLRAADVLHVDETSSNITGIRWWLHVAATPLLTAYHLHRSRCRVAVTEFDVLPQFRGTVVHDSLSLYEAYTQARHGLCGAHLVRELTAASEAHTQKVWPAQAIRALQQLNTAAHHSRERASRRSRPRSPTRATAASATR